MNQSQVSVDNIARGDPITSSSQAEENVPMSEKLLRSVLGWFYQAGLRTDRLHIQDTYEDLDFVVDRLSDLGLKLRFDWSSKSSTFGIRSVTGLHETPEGCFLYLCQTYKDGNEALLQGAPRIVVETSASESRHITEKAFKTDYSVHAAITCNFTNIPSPGSNKPFKAEIAVWVRPESGDLTLDSPCDDCYGGHKPTNTQLPIVHEGESDSANTSSDANSDRSQTPFVPPFNPSDHEHTRLDPGDRHRLQRICCRSGGWTVVDDESIQARQEGAEPVLLLDVYDILRPCFKFPGDHITDRKISISLGALRENLVLEVQRMRGPSPRPAPQTGASSRPAKKQRTA